MYLKFPLSLSVSIQNLTLSAHIISKHASIIIYNNDIEINDGEPKSERH